MTDFSYTIFDGHPARSGDCAWPSHSDVEIDADSLNEAAEKVEAIMQSEGRSCGEYAEGSTLWAIIWHNGINARTISTTL